MRILFVGAHTDDETSSAGTLTKLREKGHEIYLVVFSFCEESSEALGYPRDVLEEEFAYSMKVLKLDSEHVFAFHYPVRHFPQHRQEILEDLVRLNKSIKPHLAFIPHTMDMHQDHQTLAKEGERAFTNCSVLGYELPGKFMLSSHICFVKLSLDHWDVKEECLKCYVSQSSRPGASVKSWRMLAKLRGLQAGCGIAEAFEIIRLYL